MLAQCYRLTAKFCIYKECTFWTNYLEGVTFLVLGATGSLFSFWSASYSMSIPFLSWRGLQTQERGNLDAQQKHCSAVLQIGITSLQKRVAWLRLPHLFAVPGVCCRFLSSVKDMFRWSALASRVSIELSLSWPVKTNLT